jgi:hypothetical protein
MVGGCLKLQERLYAAMAAVPPQESGSTGTAQIGIRPNSKPKTQNPKPSCA